LRQLRLEAGYTQEELGFEADLRRTYISILELGQQQPTLTTILKLAKSLNRSAQELIGLVEAELQRAGRRRR
jgi:transcriptional regulator with XRE-family HTH domain